ncbi:hypothetical protein [Bradyrhizobium sp. 930_D9_N1_4]|uniref:hypothetical protein n=1 Tax=Bradyrhizobium sp. 930_D9_N1_4 TaxID=3240374 RepID=UPI003F8B6A9C
MRVNGTGVGIGTTAPVFPLHVYNHGVDTGYGLAGEEIYSSSFEAGLLLNNAATGGHKYNIFSSGGGSGVGNGNLAFADVTNQSTRVLISSSGNVGIGVTTPQSKLDVSGGVAVGASYAGVTAAPTNGAIIQGAVGIGTNAPTAGAALDLSYNSNSMLLPTGTSGQRPTGVVGMMRYNSAIPGVETYYNGSWNTLGTGSITSIATNNGITGGTIVGSGTIGLAPIGTVQLLANPTGSSAVPVGTSLSAVIDNAACSTQGSIFYRNGSSWTCLPPGTSGQVLQTQGASANPQWAVGGGGSSGMTLLATVNASGASSVVFNSTHLTSTYNKYVIEFDSFYPSTDNVNFELQISNDNGSTWISSSYDYAIYNHDWNGGSSVVGSGGTGNSFALLAQGVGGTSNKVGQGTIKFSMPSASAQYPVFDWKIMYWFHGPGALEDIIGSGVYDGATGAFNAVRILMSSGNINGNFHLYGLSGN